MTEHPAPTEHDLRRTFTDTAALTTRLPEVRTAVVAMIFHIANDDLKICLGRRAIVAGDPWSGDLAFPGGKPDPGDVTLHDTAARETFEEVGVPLPDHTLIGDLGEVPARGGSRPLLTYPLVYLIDEPPPPFQLDHELVDAEWISVRALWNAANWGRFSFGGREFSAIRAMGHYLWGYSLGVLHNFSIATGRPLDALMTGSSLPRIDGRAISGTRIG